MTSQANFRRLKKYEKPHTTKKIKTYRLVSEPSQAYEIVLIGSQDAYKYLSELYDDGTIEIYESFILLMVNTANRTIGWVKISQGGITGTVADVRLIMKYAIENLACGIFISHNHPSGSVKPSSADIDLTKKIKDAAKFMDIVLLDHIIVTTNGYYSFADDGMM